jgi:rubredoxin
MTRYACTVCSYGYIPALGDPEHGIRPGTPFEDLPEDWRCPWCGAGKSEFVPEREAPEDVPKDHP